MKTLSIIFSIIFLSVCSCLLCGQNSQKVRNTTAAELIGTIIKNTGSRAINNTVDIIKEGDPQTPVTGVITCMFATMEVLKTP